MTDSDTSSVGHSDVLVVGYGPVGQVLAVLLAQRGWRVTVLERWPQPFPMPRAVSFDGESARILAAAGVAAAIREHGESSREYTWTNAAGDVLLHVDVPDRGYFGWPDSTSMYQPGIEAALAARGATIPNLRVLRGHVATRLVNGPEGVELVVEGADEQRVLTADWVVGCDGANSFVRTEIGATSTDLDFSNDWLTCDVVLHDGREFRPNNQQVCDPQRPTTVVSAGPGHRRWEFMRLPGEPVDVLRDTATVWRLLERYSVTPDNATLLRHAVYTFEARCADEWRRGRALLAGDAAHLMPPFAGQGMCSGFRDAANLAWKLDLVLRGLAADALVDSYQDERRAHVQHALRMSVDLGKVICQTDPGAARDRDEVMIAARERGTSGVRPRSSMQRLTTGLLARSGGPAGGLVPQGTVARAGASGWFDDLVGYGFVLLVDGGASDVLADGLPAPLRDLDVRVVRVLPAGTPVADVGDDAVVDVDDVYLPYLSQAGSRAVLVRPDFYAFGGVDDAAGLAAVADELHTGLAAAAVTG
ncbi:bifunctional 3-(3-hydroxy-phenyl)propionate/3-hydroxycinnamic acid hydroxylase [Saccharopolyspora hordei]|uniref:Flavoprotein hydroxylase n=1 Tax=Saccharopolyspora hordei TaxID=1838 RepID=A0A853AI67_9PSEU|nr:bifunctional 3-(3-hydroxy-phenyl)propionate/3-hydroxycinnamic acid hydroxylase [Saccharopolyspora hordei]NYI84322.1 flavoprotein hydroxylase [Saccharopolyspora hordei]